MAKPTVEELMRRNSILRDRKANWDSHCQEIAERVLPRQAEFITKQTDGTKRAQKIFDSTAALAAERFGAVTEGMIMPRAQRWHGLKSSDANLNKIPRVTEYFKETTDVLFSRRYASTANFTGQTQESIISMGVFGTGPLMITENRERSGNLYRTLFLGECAFAKNESGLIDTLYWQYTLTARQAVQRWGLDLMPDSIRRKYEEKPDDEFEFLTAIQPREDREPEMMDAENMALASYHVALDDKQMILESGFPKFPVPTMRYVVSPNEVLGRGPAMLVLGDIKTLNEMERTELRSAHRMVQPPLLTHDSGPVGNRPRLWPDAVNQGALSESGQPLIRPLESGSQVQFHMEKSQQKRQSIDGAFLADVFRVLMENPNMTATQTLELMSERGVLMAPTMGRQESEFLGPMIEIEIDLAAAAGELPPMPPELIEAEGEFEIQYTSPLATAMKAQQGVSVMRSVEMIQGLGAVDPAVLDTLDTEKAADVVYEVNNTVNLKASAEDIQRKRDARAEAQRQAAMVESAPAMAGAAKDAATAAETAANV